MLKTAAFSLGFQHLPWDLANVNAWKTMFDPYNIIYENSVSDTWVVQVIKSKHELCKSENQNTDKTGGSNVSKCRLGKWLRLLYFTLNFLLFKQTVQTLIRCRVLRHLIWVSTVCQCLKCSRPSFTDNPLLTALWCHSDKNSMAINNCYLDFTILRNSWRLYIILWLYCKQLT